MSSIHLLDAVFFPAVAARNGIAQSARSLIFAGRLLPLTVGRRTYYLWSELLDLMPDWARRRHTAVDTTPIASGNYRTGLTGHTITVEHATRLVALTIGVTPGDPIAVERTDGHLGVPHAIPPGDLPTVYAEAYARTVGARYIPAGGAW